MKNFYKPSIFKWLFNALFDWALIILAIISVYISLWFLPLAIFVIGNRQHALAILGHDGGHWLVSKHKRLNDFLTVFFTFGPLLIGIDSYREFHFKHHRTVGTNKDPEIKHKVWSDPEFDLPVTRKQLILNYLKDLCALGLKHLFLLLMIIKPRKFSDILPSLLWWVTAISILVYFGLWMPIVLWLISIYTSFWACFRLRIWTEHQGIEGTHRVAVPWWLKLVACPHNTEYHWEHHKNPTVPFYLLPKYREHTKELAKIKNTKELFDYHENTDYSYKDKFNPQ